jgi:integrase/recombinase XerC
MRNLKIYTRNNQEYLRYYNAENKLVRKSINKLNEAEKIAVASLRLKVDVQQSENKVSFIKVVDEYFMATYKKNRAWKEGYSSMEHNNQADNLRYLRKLQSFENAKHVDDVNYQYLIRFLNDIRSRPIDRSGKTMSNNTANRYLTSYRSFFQFCVNMEYIAANPANKINKYKKEEYIPHFFSDEEYQLILDNSGKYRPFFEIMYETGLRPNDAYFLTQKNFTMTANGMMMKVIINKTNQLLEVPISKRATEIVQSRGPKLFPYFNEGRGYEHSKKEVRKVLKRCFAGNNSAGAKYCKKNNIKLHTFRHSFGMRLYAAGVPLESLKQLMAHRSITTTEIYARFKPKEDLRACLQ